MATEGNQGNIDDLVLETGHLLFKTAVELMQSSTSRVVTTDIPVKIPGHVCAASIWGPVCHHQ